MNTNLRTYYSNGKLLLTGEYLVLKGAEALAVPTKFGQDLVVQSIDESKIYWKSYDEKGKIWFQKVFQLSLNNSSLSDKVSDTLLQILRQAQKQNPNFLTGKQGYRVTTKLDFPRDWGLGSSSTLINNIAQWAEVDAFELLQKTIGGSGYDIACAQNNSPILYQLKDKKPIVHTTFFNPSFKDQLYFVYLNKKQQSDKEIRSFNKLQKDFTKEIETISTITDVISGTNSLYHFNSFIKEHEQIMSRVLQRKPVKEVLFTDYFGEIKSLGAWGGDFILATGNDDTPKYFKKKGFETVLLYDEMIL